MKSSPGDSRSLQGSVHVLFRLLARFVLTISAVCLALLPVLTLPQGSPIVQARGSDLQIDGQEPAPPAIPPIAPAEIDRASESPWVDGQPVPAFENLPGVQTNVESIVGVTSAVLGWRPPLYPVPWAPSAYDHFFFRRPISVDEVNWPLEDYRYGAIQEGSDVVHSGVDIDAPAGTPVLAAGDGRVIWAGYGLLLGNPNQKDPYGLAVAIRHDFGYQNEHLFTIYAHMSKLSVTDGQAVTAGDVLGEVGSTGNTTGPHLHFEVRTGDNLFSNIRNPELWMSPPQGWGLLVGQILDTGGRPVEGQLVIVVSKENRESWWVKSYGGPIANPDPYYRENMVLSDIPEGDYTVRINYLDRWFTRDVHIAGGRVTYISFYGRNGFAEELPPGSISLQFPTPTP